jgi:uncharacterized phiE125 gp8 family phage protein
MYGLRRTVEPANPALDIEQVREHLRIFDNSMDGYLRDVLIPAATGAAELATHRQLATATYELVVDRFPCYGVPIYVPVPPLQSVAIAYSDAAGDGQTWSGASYVVQTEKEPAEIWPAYGEIWPVTRREPGAVRLTFDAGYGDSYASIPPLLRSGMLLVCGHLWMNRATVVVGEGSAVEIPMASREIFSRYNAGDDYTIYDTAR